MKIIFAGTPEFAAVALKALINSAHTIIAVYTQPDRKAGRGLKLKQSAVKELALAHHLPLYQPLSLNSPSELEKLTNLHADVMVVAAYGLLLPEAVLRAPQFACINIHPSLLPRWRGAAPIQRTIFAGDTETGVTIMQMDAGLDTGPILLTRPYVLAKDETAKTLHDKLAQLGATALLETLDLISQEKIKSKPQDPDFATYAHKISKEEALIDWLRPAIEIEREVRAFNPWPVAYTTWQGENLRIWEAVAIGENHIKTEPRAIIKASADGIDIATGIGILRLLAVQLPGGKVLPVRDFYNAKKDKLIPGEHFV